MTAGEEGQVAGVEGVVFGVLVFVLGVLVVANAWAVVDAKQAVTAAAREATRAFVEAPSADTALDDATAAAKAVAKGHGRDPLRVTVHHEAGALTRCSRVRLRVSYRVPMISIPLLGRFGSGFVVNGRHAELVDPFRSGLPELTDCPVEARR